MAPSSDSVGRTFPMAVFAPLEPAHAATRFAAVPVVYAHFLAAAAALVARSRELSAAQLAEQVRALAPPPGTDFGTADEVCRRTLAASTGAELRARLFGADGAAQGRAYYAF